MKIIVGMSGGVDSSVAAAILKSQGHDVTGVTMKIFAGTGPLPEGKRHGCYGPGDEQEIAEAAAVAKSIGIPHFAIDLSHEYKQDVLDYFCDQYMAGKTPNPCVQCNRLIKFGVLVQKAAQKGLEFDKFATGHYARTGFNNGRYLLRKAADARKDQSYFLSGLTQRQLSLALFPLGEFSKSQVRTKAVEFGLPVAEKAESQDFAEGGYLSLLPEESKPGNIIDRQGKVLGKHNGIQHYTIGQRKGLGIAAPQPLYVVEIDAAANAVIVGDKSEVYGSDFMVAGLNWISIEKLTSPIKLQVKIRHAHEAQPATAIPIADGKVSVTFDEPQLAITPGQTAVFYDSDIVVGGGTIEMVTRK
ncbi:MAG TPA: tRNA 2-thiouridine(34) synthase MnmA [Dehalococcoidales bacterium]|nr:tRNA 2-thiouridine(34) synthase MnmA [Dehalococcoidales bacterium]